MNIGLFKVSAAAWRKCFYKTKPQKRNIQKGDDNSSKGPLPVAYPAASIPAPKYPNECEELGGTKQMDDKDRSESEVSVGVKLDNKEDVENT